jgi:quercetin dioxygenase-like cupin family protein
VTPTLNPARLSASIEDLKALHVRAPWSEPMVVNDRYTVTVICQDPGHQNDWHYHLVDECWYVHEGELSWTMEGQDEAIHVRAGEWVFAPANTFHLIRVHGAGAAIRVAISYTGEPHRHDREAKPPAPQGARLT